MVEKRDEFKKRKDAAERAPVETEDAGEYGLQQIMSPNEADLEEVLKQSSYHYAHDELQHKEDRVGKTK